MVPVAAAAGSVNQRTGAGSVDSVTYSVGSTTEFGCSIRRLLEGGSYWFGLVGKVQSGPRELVS